MSDSVRPHRRQPTRLPHPWDSPGKNTGVGCHFLLRCIKEKSESEVAQSCPTLSDPMDCSLPGSSIHGFSRQEYGVGRHCLLHIDAQKFLILMKSNLCIFSLATCAFDVISKNPLQIQGHEDLHTFSCKNFMVLALTFRSLIHFELIFVHGVM